MDKYELEKMKMNYLIQRMHPGAFRSGLISLISRDSWEQMRSIYNWDIYYLGMAKYVSTKSKDPSTKVGAVIVRPDNSLCSTGFNGFPRKMRDSPELYVDRDSKYSRVVHAEVNAQIFSKDASLEGYSLYSAPFAPCDRCCVQMIQAGITRFVAPTLPEGLKERWQDSMDKTKKYIEECGLVLDLVDLGSLDEVQ